VVDHPAIRARVVEILDQRMPSLASDAAAVSPFAAGDEAAGEVKERLVDLVLAVLRTSLRDGGLERRGPEVAELATCCAENP
jgi:hypothetical protein